MTTNITYIGELVYSRILVRKLVKLLDPFAKTVSLYICLNIENEDYVDFSTAVTRIQALLHQQKRGKNWGL
jgi:hypothetical protein